MEISPTCVTNMLPFVITACHLLPFFCQQGFSTSHDWFCCMSRMFLFVILWPWCHLWDWLVPSQSSSGLLAIQINIPFFLELLCFLKILFDGILIILVIFNVQKFYHLFPLDHFWQLAACCQVKHNTNILQVKDNQSSLKIKCVIKESAKKCQNRIKSSQIQKWRCKIKKTWTMMHFRLALLWGKIFI